MKELLNNYKDNLKDMIDLIDTNQIEEIHNLIKSTQYGKGRIFVAGNGGSAATVNHFCCDFSKNAILSEDGKFTVISISSQIEAITAYGNDDGYENSFKNQLQNFYPESGDIFLAISVSGNSPNVIKAADYCKERNVKIISITGFNGGKLKELSDININFDSNSYERVEDLQSLILHMVTCSFKFLEN